MVWVPKTAAELEQAIANGSLPPESATHEYKQQLPPAGKNTDIAIDVSAMTVAGGVIIYGVAENKATANFFSAPIQLQGAVERISQTIESNVQERPDFTARPLTIDGKPGEGYVVVEVPPSVRAPHLVEAKDEYRFYGRSPGGNRKLTQLEIEQLYDRRRHVLEEGRRALDDAMALAPIEPSPGRGDLHLVARTLLPDSGLRGRVFEQDNGDELRQGVLNATNALRFRHEWSPAFSQVVSGSYPHRTLDGVDIVSYPVDYPDGVEHRYTSRTEFLDDGTTRHFRAAITEMHAINEHSDPVFIMREPAVAQMVAQFILMVGQLLARGGYRGQVDVFIGITGAKGAQSASWYMGEGYERYFLSHQAHAALSTDDFRDQHRTTAEQMLADPTTVAAVLVARLARVLRPPEMIDPLQVA